MHVTWSTTLRVHNMISKLDISWLHVACTLYRTLSKPFCNIKGIMQIWGGGLKLCMVYKQFGYMLLYVEVWSVSTQWSRRQIHLGILRSVANSTIGHTNVRVLATCRAIFLALNSIGSHFGCLHPLTSLKLYCPLCLPIMHSSQYCSQCLEILC